MYSDLPLVSIITPAYNAAKYIAETIQSVLDQSYENWELIIVNDGSTDNTAEILASFNDDRIYVVEQRNSGVSAARNTGLTLLKGKYITFLDADDVLPPRSLEARIEYLEKHPEVDVVDGKIIVKDDEMHEAVRIYEPYYTGRLLPRLVALDDKVFFNVCYLFRRELLENHRFREGLSHGEDLLFYMELSVNDVRYGFVDETVYWYRNGHVSAMQNLQGLENGYGALFAYIMTLKNLSFIQKKIFCLKVAKIMFLSWMSQKKFLTGLRSVIKILKSCL